MTDDTCLNPSCKRSVPIIGVCTHCANNGYDPRRDGVSLDWAPYTTGGITQRSEDAIREQLRETKQTLERLELWGDSA